MMQVIETPPHRRKDLIDIHAYNGFEKYTCKITVKSLIQDAP